jgi:hypothetical protein
VVLCTLARAAMLSMLTSSQPRLASSSRVASSTAARVRAVRPPGRTLPAWVIRLPLCNSVLRVRSEESMAGPLLVLFCGSAKLQAGMESWLNGLKATAERR